MDPGKAVSLVAEDHVNLETLIQDIVEVGQREFIGHTEFIIRTWLVLEAHSLCQQVVANHVG